MQTYRSQQHSDVQIFIPDRFDDRRGYFVETWNAARYRKLGLEAEFVQDNMSLSEMETLRGLHFQFPLPQGKLIYVVSGQIFDVAVDIRVGSPHFGTMHAMTMTGKSGVQAYIPPGFAHGFFVRSKTATVAYKTTTPYIAANGRGVYWADPGLAIKWPVDDPIVSKADELWPCLASIPKAYLPSYEDCRASA